MLQKGCGPVTFHPSRNFDTPTNQPTNRPTYRPTDQVGHREVTLPNKNNSGKEPGGLEKLTFKLEVMDPNQELVRYIRLDNTCLCKVKA